MGSQNEVSQRSLGWGSPDGVSRWMGVQHGFTMGSQEEGFRRRPSQDGSALPVMAALRGRSRAAGRVGNPGTCRARSRDREWAVLRGEATPRPRPRAPVPPGGTAPRAGAPRVPRRRPPARLRGAYSSQRRLRAPGRGGSSSSACPGGGAPVPPPLAGCPVPRQPLAPEPRPGFASPRPVPSPCAGRQGVRASRRLPLPRDAVQQIRLGRAHRAVHQLPHPEGPPAPAVRVPAVPEWLGVPGLLAVPGLSEGYRVVCGYQGCCGARAMGAAGQAAELT